MTELSWEWIESEIKRIVLEAQKPFDRDTIANAQDLLQTCRVGAPLPDSVGKGYWSTIVLSWPGFEIEVFDDRLEIYRFNEDRSTDIWYEEHRPQSAFSEKFLSELASLKKH
jgi:hypothetical protein